MHASTIRVYAFTSFLILKRPFRFNNATGKKGGIGMNCIFIKVQQSTEFIFFAESWRRELNSVPLCAGKYAANLWYNFSDVLTWECINLVLGASSSSLYAKKLIA